MDLTYISAAQDAAPEIAHLHQACVRADYRNIVPDVYLDAPVTEKRIEAWAGWIRRSKVRTIVAHSQEGIVGFATTQPDNNEDSTELAIELIGIFVIHPHWGQGIGSRLLKSVREIAIDDGFATMTFWEYEGNKTGRRIIEALGFDATESLRPFLQDNQSVVNEVRYKCLL